MVKGVNKTVIVVNDTGNKFFEKIVFYVSDEYGNMNPKFLNKAAESYKFDFLPTYKKGKLRKNYEKRKKKVILSVIGGVLSLISIALIFIL